MPDVGAAEGERRVQARVQIGPDTWYDMDLFVLPDDGEQQINIVRPEQGAWPPPDHALLVERSSLPKIYAQMGDVVTLEMSGGEERNIRIAGLAHDLSLPPSPISGKAFGYINFETLEWLGGPQRYDHIYNQMQIVVAEQPLNEDHIWNVAALVADKIERSGREILVTDVPSPPQQHPAELVIPTILSILTALGVLALVLAMFLIINTVEAILTQQVQQIGILKAIGTRSQQIMVLYFGMVLLFGVLALLLAVPLGTLGALGFTRFMTGQLNVDISNFSVPPQVLALKIAAALLLPLLVAIPSIRSVVGITVREALSSSGPDTSHAGTTLIDRLLKHIHSLPRPLLLSLRNTFRRKWRLIRTLVVLTLGGAVFISVLTVRASLYTSLDATVGTKHYDIEIQLARSYRSAEVVQKVLEVPGVTYAEGWRRTRAYPVRPDGSEGEYIQLYAMPADTALLDLPIQEGRWLLPEDDRALVVSSNFFNKEPWATPGEQVVLNIDGEEYTWRIVGVSQEFVAPTSTALGYVDYNGFARAVGGMGRVDSVQIVTERHDKQFQEQVARGLEDHTAANNIQVRLIRATYEDQEMLYERFNILTVVLSIMATLIGLVGGLGLMGTMSINVLERTKEIGIMRAIGASDSIVQQIVMGEGVLIGMVAWLAGSILSLPISRMASNQLGMQLLSQPLSYEYALYAVGFWLVIVTIIAAGASYVPARNASRLTVREVLAYE
jgi:putative ABC transport system permease protein